MDKLTIEILNWEKFNPKRDQKTYTWLRLSNTISTDAELFGLDAEQRYVWICILCQASAENKGTLTVNLDHLSDLTKVKKSKIADLLIFLQEKPIIVVHDRARPRDVALVTHARPHTTPTDETYVRTRRTNETNVHSADAKAPQPVSELRDAFLKSYRSEFRRDYPGWGAKENGMAAKWLKSVSLENAKRLASLYPKWNDPWVTKQGHPLGILVSQYVQLDAWAQGSKQLIQKIAAGKAAERVDLNRAVDFEEMKRGLNNTVRRQQEAESLSDLGHIQEQLSGGAPQGIPREPGDPFGPEVFDLPGEIDSA